jgi:hypothetical protein
MIKGKKHDWCGRVNWENVPVCPRCSQSTIDFIAKQNKTILDYSSVVFDAPELEAIVPIIKEAARMLGKENRIEFEFITEYEGTTEEDAVPAIGANGFYIFKHDHGWDVETSVTIHNYPHEPDDEEPVFIGTFGNDIGAVLGMFKAMIDEELMNMQESLYYTFKHKEETFPV